MQYYLDGITSIYAQIYICFDCFLVCFIHPCRFASSACLPRVWFHCTTTQAWRYSASFFLDLCTSNPMTGLICLRTPLRLSIPCTVSSSFLIMTFSFGLSESPFGLFHITSCRLVLHLHTYILVIGLLVFAVLAVQPPGLRLAKVKTDGTFTAPCRTSVLFPQDGGNLHCFTAITSCAVLDVLGPPYSNPEEGRDCTYYNDSPYASFCGTIINTCICQLRKLSFDRFGTFVFWRLRDTHRKKFTLVEYFGTISARIHIYNLSVE